jgi:hypothetical protein
MMHMMSSLESVLLYSELTWIKTVGMKDVRAPMGTAGGDQLEVCGAVDEQAA